MTQVSFRVITNYLKLLWFLALITLRYPSLLLFQESQFSTFNSATPIIHSAVTSVTPTSHSKENVNHNEHNLKDGRIEQWNVELKALKALICDEKND